MIDNKERIKNIISFDNEGDIFYYAQIIKRRKENPGLEKGEVKLGSMFITSREKLEDYWKLMTPRAKVENARIYVSLCPRSLRKFTALCLMEYSKRVLNNSYTNSWKIPDSVALSKNTIRTKGVVNGGSFWIVDIDSRNEQYKNEIAEFIREHVNIVEILDTPNGYHLVIKPFNYRNMDKYLVSKKLENYVLPGGCEFSLKREGNTILYAP